MKMNKSILRFANAMLSPMGAAHGAREPRVSATHTPTFYQPTDSCQIPELAIFTDFSSARGITGYSSRWEHLTAYRSATAPALLRLGGEEFSLSPSAFRGCLPHAISGQ